MTEASHPQGRIAATLARHLGMAAESVGHRVIESAVRRRMVATGVVGIAEYADRVAADRRELDELVEAVVVPETWFFRYPESFKHLTKWAVQRRASGLMNRSLRILSAPCATGEEPYSLAVALLEAGMPSGSFRIDAVDVCKRAVKIGEAGRYGDTAFREQNPLSKSRHLKVEGREIVIAEDARSAVHFRVGNLMNPGVFAGDAPFDAIFCRNLFIYLTEDARKAVIRTLERVLVPDGLVYMGHAEPLGLMDARFRSVSPPAAFAFTRADAVKPEPASTAELPRAKPAAAAKPIDMPMSLRSSGSSAMHRAINLLDLARASADKGDADAAIDYCDKHIKQKGPDADALTLRGVVRATSGDAAKAERDFTQALFLDPGHYDALLNMYALAKGRGDKVAAENYRRRIDSAVRREGRP